MEKQQKNVYPNQPQSVNYNMMNHMHLQQQHQPQPFYQNHVAAAVPQMQPMYYASAPPYQPQPQHFMMGPPPAYSNAATSPYPTGYCPPPAYQPPIFHNVAGTVPMSVAPQTAVFDAGARFNGKGPVSIPPPPPGYLPSAAQAAVMQGQTVVVDKKKNNFFTGGKGAGYTFW